MSSYKVLRLKIKGKSFLNLIHGISDDDVLCLITNILDSMPLIKKKPALRHEMIYFV